MKRIALVAATLFLGAGAASAQLAQTPQMGWSTWNKF